ncbi:MAG: alpha/beta hydrolase [Lachnospiraceae bacterium]|nr:alpha/beta hydrolase [Lachnospiraceae bacterium]
MSVKLAVLFPGIGYHKDKPLLYYASKLLLTRGYDIMSIEYQDMPQKIKGDAKMMKKAAELAYEQSKKQLAPVDFSQYEEVVFVGKSIGTVALSKYASDQGIDAKQVWYTPVEATFLTDSNNVIAFIGDDDPWSDVDKVKKMAKERGIDIYSYPGCNHSLECDDVDRNLGILREVMQKTGSFLWQN